MKKFTLFILLLFVSVQHSRAAVESAVERREGNQLVVSGTPLFTIYDNKYTQMATDPTWGTVFTNYRVSNVLRLGLNPDVPQTDDLSGTITFTIKTWTWNAGTSSFDISTETGRVLTLLYSAANPTDIVDEINSYAFEDAHKIEVYITAISGGTFDVEDVYVSAEIEVERYYALDNIAVTGLTIDTPTDNSEYYQFDWDHKQGAEFYELEWVHISDATLEDAVYKATSALKYNYYLNSTRILVKGNSYRIPKIFDHGYLIYRIRPVGLVGGAFNIRKPGAWTNGESGTVASHTAANRLAITTDYDEHMNWSHQVAYGDYGERFESVSFADGLGRGRQSVGHNTETQQAVVSNVYYDELGRPVISDLPTPEDGEVLRHKANFNLADENPGDPYQQQYFDSELSVDVCNPLGGGFSTTSGAGEYYSSSNPDQDGENVRIPDAAKFPFSRVTYRNDFTGRVDKVSGIGADLKIGSGRETSFAYPSANQAELDRLFGAEVGQASHYEKMVTIDANGQVYVQYSDMAGRVVASFMAGETPSGVDAIDGNGAATVTIGLLPENDQAISDVLPSSTLTYNEFIYEDGTYIFDYAFTPQQFQDACMEEEVCLDCVYDFSMTIVDKCGDSIFHYGESFLGADLDQLCEEKDPYTYTTEGLFLEKGEYTFIKKLEVNQQAIADNWCYYVDNATCLEPLSDIFNAEYEQETFPFCSVEVDDDQLQGCDARRAIMLQDLSPGGQYALFTNTGGVFTPLTLSSSVHSVLTEDALGTNLDWKHPLTPYLNADLSTALINGAAPELASFQDFVTNFQPSWANSLITYHPEYCFLEFCDSNEASNAYDQEMLDIYTFDDACAGGFFKPLSSSQVITPVPCSSMTTHYDPFFQSGGEGVTEYTNMENDMDDYMGSGFSIWEYAIYEAYCGGAGSIGDCLAGYIRDDNKDVDCYEDLIWIKFRELYLTLKQQKVNAILSGLCDNDKIGVHPNWINNTSVWGNPDALPDADGSGFPEDGSGLTEAEFDTYMDAQVAAQCQTSCEEYADEWLIALEGCEELSGLSPTDLTNLRNDLIALCMDGCDSDHPMGASTSTTGGTIDDILVTYFGAGYEDEFCTGLLISSPPAYQTPAEMADLIIKPLDTCACNVILTAQYDIENDINNPNDYNLEQLIASRTGVSLEDAHYMYCACNSKLGVAEGPYDPETFEWSGGAPAFLEGTGITIPAGLACSSGNGCVDCDEVGELMITLAERFDEVDDFENTANYPVILTNYLNSELHFTLSYNDYIEFLNKCNSSSENPYCTINPLVYEWLEVSKLLAFRGMLLTPDTDPIDLMATNIVFANGEWQHQLTGNNYWSEVSGSFLRMYFGVDEGTHCYVRLTLPEDPDFGFEDIVSFEQILPFSTNCDEPNTDFYVTVSYYSCGILTTATLVGRSDCFEVTECVCDPEGLTLCDKIPEPETICYQPRLDEMYQNALTQYDQNTEALYDDYVAGYKTACAAAFATEALEYTGPQNTYQYTLFFYDQAGNLVRTVAPAGIPATFDQSDVEAARNSVNSSTDYDPVGSFTNYPFPDNTFETRYTYNSYNQLVTTENPDQIDSTKFWYDFYGRMVASQNPVQRDDNQYSYVLYDVQGRPVEVGQTDCNVPPIGGGSPSTNTPIDEDDLKIDDLGAAFKNWVYNGYRTEVTFTVYDEPMDPAIVSFFGTGGQQNLRLRVASVIYFDVVTADPMPVTGYVSATHYSYDLHGNVIEHLQDVPALAPVEQDIKSTRYEFELLSGNVKKVEYQKDERDRMTHEYVYDKLYRLAEVLTSTDDGVHKSREAHYRYFDYGPLARVETGQHKVQGNDYAYTINGWLKNMNSTTIDRLHDAGSDGAMGYSASNPQVHELVARDVTGYTMGYFPGDYTSIGTTSFEAALGTSNDFADAVKPLFNGNIAYTTTAVDGLPHIQGAAYAYDQLQRLKQMRVFRSTTLADDNDWSNSAETPEYSSSYTYDKNGNLLTLVRKATTATTLDMDDFAYNYVLGSNRLTYVDDNASANGILEDIEPGQSGTTGVDINGTHTSDNYQYDKLGQLVKDVQENLTMIWRDGDKKLKLQKGTNQQLEFVYNPFGQRVYKVEKAVISTTVQGQGTTPWVYTYYAYDANGQLMATYDVTMNDHDPDNEIYEATNSEQLIYGSGRIGVIKPDKITWTNQVSLAPEGPEWVNQLGEKNYELTNHLGNVNAVITDRKLINSTYVVNTFTSSTESWLTCANASVTQIGSNLQVTTSSASNNCTYKAFTVTAGELYTLRVKSAPGTGVTALKVQVYDGVTLLEDVPLDNGDFTTVLFTCTGTSATIIIQPISGNGVYTVDEVRLFSGSNYEAVAIMQADYYPFGMQMPDGRSVTTNNYRFGYNGMEKDPEFKGDGNSYTTEFRQYDPRIGRWASLDPLMGQFPNLSPYCGFDNNPVYYTDPFGLESTTNGDPPVSKTMKHFAKALKKAAEEITDLEEVVILAKSKDGSIKNKSSKGSDSSSSTNTVPSGGISFAGQVSPLPLGRLTDPATNEYFREAVEQGGAFLLGLSNSAASNVVLGVGRQDPNDYGDCADSFHAGQVAGDYMSMVFGAIEVVAGVSFQVPAKVLEGSGVGTPVGIVIDIGGIALATHGTTVISTATSARIKDDYESTVNSNTSNGSSGSSIGKNAKKADTKDIDKILGNNWHKNGAKTKFLKPYLKQLKGSTNADFYIDKTTKEILLKGNKSNAWVRTGQYAP